MADAVIINNVKEREEVSLVEPEWASKTSFQI
jgi:hypothetical protein